jgi:hypothetical protein
MKVLNNEAAEFFLSREQIRRTAHRIQEKAQLNRGPFVGHALK